MHNVIADQLGQSVSIIPDFVCSQPAFVSPGELLTRCRQSRSPICLEREEKPYSPVTQKCNCHTSCWWCQNTRCMTADCGHKPDRLRTHVDPCTLPTSLKCACEHCEVDSLVLEAVCWWKSVDLDNRVPLTERIKHTFLGNVMAVASFSRICELPPCSQWQADLWDGQSCGRTDLQRGADLVTSRTLQAELNVLRASFKKSLGYPEEPKSTIDHSRP